MKLIQRLTLVMLVIAASVLLGAVSVFHNQDMSQYRDRIQQLMLDKTGRDLQVRGDIRATLFPSVGLSLRDVWIANAAGFNDSPFAEVEVARLCLDLLPLLGGDISINRLELQGPTLNLQLDEQGRSNWADLMQQTSLVEARSDEDILQEIEAAAPVAGVLSIGALAIAGGQLNWIDRERDRRTEFQNLSLESGRIALLEPFDLALQFDAMPDDGDYTTSVGARGEIDIDLQNNRFILDLESLDTTTNMSDRPTSNVGASLSGKLLADFAAQTLEISSMAGELADVPFNGELYISQLLTEPALFGELHADGIDGANLLVDLGMRLPAGLDGNLLRNASVDTRLQYGAGELALSGLVFESGGIKLYGDLLAANLTSSPVYSATLRSDRFDGRPWLAALGLQTPADETLFRNIQLQSEIRQSGQLLALNKLQLQLDDVQVAGHVEVADLQAAVQPLRFELRVDELDLHRYRDLNLARADAERRIVDALEQLLATLPSLDIQGLLEVGLLRIAGLELGDVELPMLAREDRVELKEASASLYSGSVFASLALDASLEPPRGSATINLNGFELEPLLSDLYGEDGALLSGTGNVNVDFYGRGEQLEQMLDGTSGALSLKLTNGTLFFVDVADELRAASANLTGEQPQIDRQLSRTPYTELNLSAVFEQRLLRSEDLSLVTPLMRITGLGEVDLAAAQLDTALTGTLTTSTGQGNDDLVILNGLQLPLRLRGDVAALRNNFSGLSKSELRESLQDVLEQRREELMQQMLQDRQRREAQRESDLESGLQQQRDSVESKMVDEVPTAASDKATGSEEAFLRALETGKARFGSEMSEETRRELSNLIDD